MPTAILVEDSGSCAQMLEIVLDRTAYTIVGRARTTRDALALYCKTHPNVVLMDVQLMGSDDGLSTADCLKVIDPAVCVVYVSYRRELQAQMREASGRGYIDKSVFAGFDGTVRRDVLSVLNYALYGRVPQTVSWTKYKLEVTDGFAVMAPPEGGSR